MTETSPGSNPPTQDTIPPTPGTTPSSAESIVALPQLREAKAPVSLTLTIDKSVSKVAGWVLIVLFLNALLMGAGVMAAVWMISEYNKTEREVRLQRLETDELKAAALRAGIKMHEETDKP